MNSAYTIKPVFKGEDAFFAALNKEVKTNILNNRSIKNMIAAKAIIFLMLYLVSYTCILIFGNQTPLLFLFYILSGFLMIMVFLNGFHDAAHGAVFKTRKHNERYAYVLELFGSNNFVWKKRHLLLHHPYPNMQHWDIDIKQSDILKLFPESRYLSMHKYQHIYMWFLYLFYTLNWILIRDFKDFYGTKDNYLNKVTKIPRNEHFKLFAAKILNLFMMLALPMMVLEQPWYMVLAAFLTMHVLSSAFGVMALLSTHVDETSEFPLPPEDGIVKMSWASYQVMVTKDFCTNSKLANLLFGGFNHHVAHHLFPHVAHTYYPYITPLIKQYAQEHGFKYYSHSLTEAIASHYYLLKRCGREENLFVVGEM